MGVQIDDSSVHRDKIRIALADDHRIFRDALRALLSTEPDFEVIAEAADGRQVPEMLNQHEVDILLLDLMMPGVDGLSLLRRLSSTNVKTSVILLTATDDTQIHVLALKYGASGVVVKGRASEYLLEGIRKVARGEICVDAKTMLGALRQISQPKLYEELTTAEEEVVSLVCEGLRNKEIADRLCVSEDTVKTHLRHIFKKTGVNDRMHLVLFAMKSNLPALRHA